MAGDRNEHFIGDAYMVRSIYPPLPLLTHRPEVPGQVMTQVERAEKLIWVDPPAAMTAVRSAVEELVLERGVPDKGNLRDKLKAFEKINSTIYKLLDSTRIMGNSATHDNDALTSEVAEQLSFLEIAFDALYPTPTPDHSNAYARADTIIAANSPVRS